jgi:cytochrome P450
MLEMKVVLRQLLTRLESEPLSLQRARSVARGPTIAPQRGARVRITGVLAGASAMETAAATVA